MLVVAGDSNQLVFEESASMKARREKEQEAQEFLRIAADFKCDAKMLQALKEDGFVKIEGAVPKELTDQALKYINMSIGQSAKGTDQFKVRHTPCLSRHNILAHYS